MELGLEGFIGWPSCEGHRAVGAGVWGKAIQTFAGLTTGKRLLLLMCKLCLRPVGPLVTQQGSHPSCTALPLPCTPARSPCLQSSALVSLLPGPPFPHSAQWGLLILYLKHHEPPCFIWDADNPMQSQTLTFVISSGGSTTYRETSTSSYLH